MKSFCIGAVALAFSVPLSAATVTTAFSGAGSGQTSNFSFSGFDGSLGQLDRIDFLLPTGSSLIQVKPGFPYGAPGSSVTYKVSVTTYVYFDGSNESPAIAESASGSAIVGPDGSFTAATSGADGSDTITNPNDLAKFVGGTITGKFDVFVNSVYVNGTLDIAGDKSVLQNSTSASVTYSYTPRGGSVVPEPQNWAMMAAGFGLVGAAARRRRWHSAA